MSPKGKDVLALLTTRGGLPSSSIQEALKLSQPTVSRILSEIGDEIVVLGRGKSTQYAVAHAIGTFPAQQPLWHIDQSGAPERIGTVCLLAKDQIHIEGDGVSHLFDSTPQELLPWVLSPLRAQGFLGRMLAGRLAHYGVPSNPETWNVEAALISALNIHDAPGALLLGTHAQKSRLMQMDANDPAQLLDHIALDIVKTLPIGSSAGGEQPKFPVLDAQGNPWLVKFSPPRGTPFGDRWSDLLCAEALCNQALERHGFEAAQSQILQSQTRTYLLSKRFDRCAGDGRKHVVSIGSVHAAFVKGGYVNWASTSDALARQGRLSRLDAQACHSMLQFGRLVGNTDMHSGNASLFVEGSSLQEIMRGNFKLAPTYDMLPMRWKPDAMVGVVDYTPFDVDYSLADAATRAAAREFWVALSRHALTSAVLREVASTMAERMG